MKYLTPGNSYHIFNHANGFENVFCNQENFRYFLEKYRLYISPVAETYAYCLMPNHFHVVVRIRKREVIESLIRNKNFGKVKHRPENATTKDVNFSKVNNKLAIPDTNKNFGKVNTKTIIFDTYDSNFSKVKEISDHEIEKYISKQFANLFSCYTQSFNKVHHRMGSLFIKNYKREQILNKRHFFNAIIYTHRNPIHHGLRKHYNEWDFSSYNEIVEGNHDHVEVLKLLKMIGGIRLFIAIHRFALINFDNAAGLDIP